VVAASVFLRRVLELATEEAARFGHRYVGPEHLLGIEHRPQGKGLGAAWLAGRGLTVTRIDDPYPWSLASP
jgi:hypothetical protein